MNAVSSLAPVETRYELRFKDLFGGGHGYAFPCDAQGQVDLEELSDRALVNYLFARALVGKELSRPTVSPVVA